MGMISPSLTSIDPITRTAGVALLFGILTQYQSSRQSEVCSETLCWVLLPTVCKIVRRPGISRFFDDATPENPAESRQPASIASLWVVASGVVAFCISKAEIGMVELIPVLTPLLLLAQRHLGSERHTSVPSLLSPFVNTVWGTSLAALLAVVTLTEWHLFGYTLAIIPVAALLVVYVTLTPRAETTSWFLPSFDVEEAIVPLSLRIIALLASALGLETVAFGFPKINIVVTLIAAWLKALYWYFIIQAARHGSWRAATTAGTFTILSLRDPFLQQSSLQTLLHLTASFSALGQIINLLPTRAKAKAALWAFALFTLVPYLAITLVIELEEASSPGNPQEHPVEILIRNAKSDFEGMLHKQSQSYQAAHDEYLRRYGIEPPPGFKAWYEFARSRQSPIIDEFDVIHDVISPFLKLSGKEVLQNIGHVQNAPGSDLWLCELSGNILDEATMYCSHPYRSYDRGNQLFFNTLLRDIKRGVLPNVKFLVNHFDEPRVLAPPPAPEGHNGAFNITDMSKRATWEVLTKHCPVEKSGKTEAKRKVDDYGLGLVDNRTSAMDLCQHPEYLNMHGLVMSPPTFSLIEGLAPILSTGSPSTMGDILYPSSAYQESEFKYSDKHDVNWESKRNNLYWAGSTTGSFASDDSWRDHHRQRFVALAQNLDRKAHYYLRDNGGGSVVPMKSSFFNHRLFDVAFTQIFGCETRYCRDQRLYFHTRPWADRNKALRSRLVFDVDGNGISGRYYRLLASRSAPLKQTLLREWHDDRLVPWVHYIPVSQGMEELPELVFYLTSTPSGRERAREIAQQGRDWFLKAFREGDFVVYVYRLLLELARLQDPERPAG